MPVRVTGLAVLKDTLTVCELAVGWEIVVKVVAAV